MEAVVGGLEVDDHGKHYFYPVVMADNVFLTKYITITQWTIVHSIGENMISILVRHSASQHLIVYTDRVPVVLDIDIYNHYLILNHHLFIFIHCSKRTTGIYQLKQHFKPLEICQSFNNPFLYWLFQRH